MSLHKIVWRSITVIVSKHRHLNLLGKPGIYATVRLRFTLYQTQKPRPSVAVMGHADRWLPIGAGITMSAGYGRVIDAQFRHRTAGQPQGRSPFSYRARPLCR